MFLGSWLGYIAQKVKLFERLTMTWPPTNDKWKKADRKTMCLLCSKVDKVVKQNPAFWTTFLARVSKSF